MAKTLSYEQHWPLRHLIKAIAKQPRSDFYPEQKKAK